jgi:site-specific recombinase XerD
MDQNLPISDLSQVQALSQALIAFQTAGMPAKDFSSRTRTEYTHDLTELLTFLAKQAVTTVEQVTLPHLEAYQADMDRRGLALFVTKFKTPMSGLSIQNAVTKYLKEAGIAGVSVHSLRHTMATHHVAKGTDLKVVQETLGHASLATTTLYVSLAKKAQRKALQAHAL